MENFKRNIFEARIAENGMNHKFTLPVVQCKIKIISNLD